jgi:GTP cyclohydrolase I
MTGSDPHYEENGHAVTQINGHAISRMTATAPVLRQQELPPNGAASPAIPADQIDDDDAWQVDLHAAQRAAAAFLRALGLDLDNEDMRDTPARMTRAYAELFDARRPRLTTFPNDAGYDEVVLVREIPFRTVCEHHLLPFSGVAHVAYLPGERLVGLSKLARLVEFFAARPQTQERMTRQLADYLATQLSARWAGVVLEAEHTCMTLRGVRAQGAKTVTTALAGPLCTDPQQRAEFLALTNVQR